MQDIGKFFGAAALAVAVATPALAGDLKPIQDQRIDLGSVAGDAYYTVEPDGFRVVATFAQRGESGAPVRFQAILAPGQSVIFSTPRGLGEPANEVEIVRQQNRILVHKAAS